MVIQVQVVNFRLVTLTLQSQPLVHIWEIQVSTMSGFLKQKGKQKAKQVYILKYRKAISCIKVIQERIQSVSLNRFLELEF